MLRVRFFSAGPLRFPRDSSRILSGFFQISPGFSSRVAVFWFCFVVALRLLCLLCFVSLCVCCGVVAFAFSHCFALLCFALRWFALLCDASFCFLLYFALLCVASLRFVL